MGIKKAEFRQGKATLGSITSRWCVSTIRTILPSTFRVTPYIFEYMMTVNHTVFEKDGVFRFHISTCHLEQLVTVVEGMPTLYVHVHIAIISRETHARHGFIITSLFGAYPLLGTCLLTTYAHKRICLLTRVYGITFNFYSGLPHISIINSMVSSAIWD